MNDISNQLTTAENSGESILPQGEGAQSSREVITATTIATAEKVSGHIVQEIWTIHTENFSGGSGSSEDPYLIATAGQLANIAKLVCDEGKELKSHFKLTANIDLSQYPWKPIGHDDQIFRGTFDGDHFTIYGMTVSATGIKGKWLNLGLFGRTDGAEIKNVNLTGVSINANQSYNETVQAGGIVGLAVNSRICDCAVQGDCIRVKFPKVKGVSVAGIYVGGIVGRFHDNIGNWGTDIARSVSNIDVIGESLRGITDIHLGGIVGQGGWAGNYGVRSSFATGHTYGSTCAEFAAIGTVIGFCNLNSKYSEHLYYLNEAGVSGIGDYYFSANEITTSTADKNEIESKMKDLLVSQNWKLSPDVNNGYAFPGKGVYLVTFTGMVEANVTRDAAYGYPMTMPAAPVREGAVFMGWFAGSARYQAGDIYLMTAPLTLTAKWTTTQKYTITFDKQGGSNGSEHVIVAQGESMPIIALPTRKGYTFGGYFSQIGAVGTMYYDAIGNCTHTWDSASDGILYAGWSALSCLVLLKKRSGSGGTDEIRPVYDQPMPSITLPARTDYTFGGYYLYPGGEGTQYYKATGESAANWNMCCDTALYANWIMNFKTTVSLSADNANSIYSGGSTVATITAGVTHTYTGAVDRLEWSKDGTRVEGTDHKLELSAAEQSGNYTATVTSTYEGITYAPVTSNTIAVAIAQAKITFDVSNNIQTYDGTPKYATVAQTTGQTPIIGTVDYRVHYKQGETVITEPTKFGDYVIMVTLLNNNFDFAAKEHVTVVGRTAEVGILMIQLGN